MKDETITLVENNKIVSDERELVEISSKYFGNIVQNLGIDGLTNTSSDNDAVTIRQAIETAALLADLSKAFDCLAHDLLIAKLHACGVQKECLNLLFCYLKNREQRVRLNNT